MKSACAEDTITASKVEETRPKQIIDLSVTQHKKNGQEVQKLVLQSVTFTLHGSYNLFSVMKSIKDRWVLYGYITNIGTIKGNNKVEFNIVINTPKGASFCTHFRNNTEKFKRRS